MCHLCLKKILDNIFKKLAVEVQFSLFHNTIIFMHRSRSSLEGVAIISLFGCNYDYWEE